MTHVNADSRAGDQPSEAVMRLTPDDRVDARAILADAFAHYPVMTWMLDVERPGYRERLVTLFDFFLTARWLRQEPVLGWRADGRLEGVVLASFPDVAAPPSLAAAREATWERLGTEARDRYATYGEASNRLLDPDAAVQVNLLGVHPRAQRRGVARALLDAVHRDVARPGDAVRLATESAGNVPIYERLGYVVTGTSPIAPGITGWGLRFVRR